MIFAVGAGDRVVGVTLNDNYPDRAKELPKVGDQTIDLERLVSLEPDLVVLDSAFNQNRRSIERLGLRILELRCERLDDVPQAMIELGEALGLEEEASEQADAFSEALANVERLEGKVSVFVEIWNDPLMTAGGDTLVDDVLNVLGLHNSYYDVDGYFQVDPEDVISRRPDVILLPEAPGQMMGSRSQGLLERVDLGEVVIKIDPDLLVRPGPRLLDGIEILRQALEDHD